jgi:hypothetical protein
MTIPVVTLSPHYSLGTLLELADSLVPDDAPDYQQAFSTALDDARQLLDSGVLDSYSKAWDTWASWAQPLPFEEGC